MKTNKFSLKLLRYGIVNATSNIFTLMFGVGFPIFMSMLFSFVFSSQIPPEEIQLFNATLFITMIMIIPMATMFIGHAANYSQEIENGSLQRFKLFGYKESTLLFYKLLANLIFLTGALIVYCGVMFIALDIAAPKFAAFAVLIVFIYLFAAALLVLSHAIATMMRRFGPTYGVTMTLYFAFMTLGGMMGISPSEFPPFLRTLCKGLPMYYINTDFINFWETGAYDKFLPLGLSLLGLMLVAGGLMVLSVYLHKKRGGKPSAPKPVYYD